MASLQLLFLLLLSLGPVFCQSDAYKEEGAIPRWGRGLIASGVFLFLVFVFYMANKAWNRRANSNLESISMGKFEEGAIPNGSTGRYITKSSDYGNIEHAYENPIQVTDNELSTPM